MWVRTQALFTNRCKNKSEKTILAIEPLPANLAELSMNREYNDLKNISIMPAAAFSTNTFCNEINK